MNLTSDERKAMREFHLGEARKYERQAARGFTDARSYATHHRKEAAKYAEPEPQS